MTRKMTQEELARWASLLPDNRLAFIAEAGHTCGYSGEQVRAAKKEIENREGL